MKKIQKYVITRDVDGDDAVWNLHRDLSMTASAMPPQWLNHTDTPVIDLRSGTYQEYGPGQFYDDKDITHGKSE